MKININIYEPPSTSKKTDIDTSLKVEDFKKQFQIKYKAKVKFPRPVFLHFALEGGYGALSKLSQSLKATPKEIAGLKHVLLERMKFIDKTLDLGKTYAHPTLPHGWTYIETSEKNFWSFCIGLIGARFGAAKLLSSNGLTLKRFLHKSIYCNESLVFPGQLIGTIPVSIGPKGSEAVPDFLAVDNNNRWHVFEAKGTGGTAFWSVGRDGLGQALNCAAVGYIGAWTYTRALPRPASYSSVVTSVTSESAAIHIIDPEGGPDSPNGFSLAFSRQVMNLWEISVLADLVDSFKSEGSYWSEPSKQMSGYKISELGIRISIPTIWLSEVENLRTSRRKIIEMTNLLRLFTLDHKSSNQEERRVALQKLRDENLWPQRRRAKGISDAAGDFMNQISSGSEEERRLTAYRIFNRYKARVMYSKNGNIRSTAQIVKEGRKIIEAFLLKSVTLDEAGDDNLEKLGFISHNGLCVSNMDAPDEQNKIII